MTAREQAAREFAVLLHQRGSTADALGDNDIWGFWLGQCLTADQQVLARHLGRHEMQRRKFASAVRRHLRRQQRRYGWTR